MKKIFPVMLALLLCSCRWYVIDGCNRDDGPRFTVRSLPQATLNQEYSVLIKAHNPERSNDDWYTYYFDWSGDLPAGLRTYHEYQSREFRIEGTPTEQGEFRFKLRVEARDYDGYDLDSEWCRTTYAKTYTLTVI